MSAFAKSIRLLALPLAALLLAGCERPPVVSVQTGYRGTGMEQVYNPRTLAQQASLNAAPAPQPAAASDGPKAKEIYQNVQVLGDLSVAEFTRHMTAITQWVAPTQGCGYCHNLQNLADDSKYTKVVARRMIQMAETRRRHRGHLLHLPPRQPGAGAGLVRAQGSPSRELADG
jgi:photosynthetic reaction center cytochrome c subunit